MRKYEDMFRPAHEGYAVAGWAAGALLLVLFRPPFWWAAFPVILVMLMFRGGQLETLWKFRLSLAVMLAPTIPILTLLPSRARCESKKRACI